MFWGELPERPGPHPTPNATFPPKKRRFNIAGLNPLIRLANSWEGNVAFGGAQPLGTPMMGLVPRSNLCQAGSDPSGAIFC